MSSWRGRARTGLSVALAMLLMAAVAGCDGPPKPPSPSHVPPGGTLRPIVDRPPRVLIVGDSIADQHGSHALVALEEMGIDARLTAFWGWSLFSRDQYDNGVSNPNPPDGTLMRAALTSAADFDPDVVAIYSNHNYWPPFPRDAAGNEIPMGSAAFNEMVRVQLAALVQGIRDVGSTPGDALIYLVKPVPSEPDKSAADNAIWNAYLAARADLDVGIINSGDILADQTGKHLQRLTDCSGQSRDVRPPNDIHLTYYGAGLAGSVTARALAAATDSPTFGGSAPAEAPVAITRGDPGYRVITCDGATFQFGDPRKGIGGHALGSTRTHNDPVVGATKAGLGHRTLLVTAAGKVLPLGAAIHRGDATGLSGEHRAVGITATASYGGYWVATNQGQVQAFGDATALGDLAGQGQTVVAIAATRDRTGYWLLTSTGRVVPFGTATHLGDLEASPPSSPIIGMAAHPQSDGYWILDKAGNVHPFGTATQLGSAANQDFLKIVGYEDPPGRWITEVVPASEHPTFATAMLPSPSGAGYWITLANGAVCRFGDATAINGIHRAQVNGLLVFFGHEYYEAGVSPCGAAASAPSSVESLTTLAGDDLSSLPEIPAAELPSDVATEASPPLADATL